MKFVFSGFSLVFEGFCPDVRSCFLIELLNVVLAYGVEMCNCCCGAVVEVVEILVGRCWLELCGGKSPSNYGFWKMSFGYRSFGYGGLLDANCIIVYHNRRKIALLATVLLMLGKLCSLVQKTHSHHPYLPVLYITLDRHGFL